MIKHIVCWKFKEEAEGRSKQENMAWVKEHLTALVGQVPSLVSLEIGENIVESDMAYDMGLICTFQDLEGLKAYKVDPRHQEISRYVAKIREGRVSVDWEF